MKAILKKIFEGQTLPRLEAEEAMAMVLEGVAGPEQIAAFLGALQVRQETTEELAGFLDALRARALPVPVRRTDLFDTCGTGGDGAQTFNISTVTGMVMAATGVGIAKHGNRSVSSRCGSADVLEALGVNIQLPPEKTAQAMEKIGFGFLFAPQYHPALARVAPLRRALEVRTVFNVLGPLANPAKTRRQLVGVYQAGLLPKFAGVLRELGLEEAMVVSSEDGLDEISLGAPTRVAHLKNGEIRYYQVTPEEAGLTRQSLDGLRGGDAATNARLIEKILQGEARGAARDVVLLNAAAGLIVSGAVATLREGVALAGEVLDNGKALKVLQKLREEKP